MKHLRNPFVIGALGLLVGSSSGTFWFWRQASQMLITAAQVRARILQQGQPEAPWGFWSLEMENLAAELRDQKALLFKREESIDQREGRLAAERDELEKVRTDLAAMRADISRRIIEISDTEAKNLRTLSQTYTSLTPRAAVAIFREMNDVTVVKILSLMKADVVGPIFEEMSRASARDPASAQRAALLTEKLRLVKSTRLAGQP
jgi:flagellar motility protein MotE (MotC chaperone)